MSGWRSGDTGAGATELTDTAEAEAAAEPLADVAGAAEPAPVDAEAGAPLADPAPLEAEAGGELAGTTAGLLDAVDPPHAARTTPTPPMPSTVRSCRLVIEFVKTLFPFLATKFVFLPGLWSGLVQLSAT